VDFKRGWDKIDIHIPDLPLEMSEFDILLGNKARTIAWREPETF
jgi:hypothetical protein